MSKPDEKKDDLLWGIVTEALPGPRFRVLLDKSANISKEISGVRETDDGLEIIAYLSGKMRIKRIRVIVGDKVALEYDPLLGGQARIVIRG